MTAHDRTERQTRLEMSRGDAVHHVDDGVDGLHEQSAEQEGEGDADGKADEDDDNDERVCVNGVQSRFGVYAEDVCQDERQSHHHDKHGDQDQKHGSHKQKCQGNAVGIFTAQSRKTLKSVFCLHTFFTAL